MGKGALRAAFERSLRSPQDALGEDPARHHAKIADGQDYQLPATIENSAVLTETDKRLRSIGYARKQGVSSASSSS